MEQPKCPTTDEWIKEMWYSYTMEFYSAKKSNEILSFAGIWMEHLKFRRPKASCLLSYVEYRTKTNTAIL
jgi:hypothetical protein